MRGENDKVCDSLQCLKLISTNAGWHQSNETHSLELIGILLNSLRVKHLAIMLTDIKVLVVMFSKNYLLLVIAQLQIGDIIFGFRRRVINRALLLLLLPFLLFFLKLFWT